jgi:hypothetical protein
MTTFRCSLFAAALLVSPSPSPAATDPNLQAAAKAALGGLEVRQRNVPGPGETTIIKADRLLELPFGPVLITTVNIDRGSHAEDGSLGIYYLRRTGSRYSVRNKWPKAVDGAGFGYAPDWRLTTRFTKFPALYATAGWTGQGYTCGWSILTELTPAGPIVSDTIYNSYSDAGVGAGKVHEFNGRILNVRKAGSFDVVASGTRRFAEHYLFRRDRFIRTDKESRFQC